MARYYFAGAPYIPGTKIPANVMGDCPHEHQSVETARRCIKKTDRAVKRGNGPNAYCDRQVMVFLPGEGRMTLAEFEERQRS